MRLLLAAVLVSLLAAPIASQQPVAFHNTERLHHPTRTGVQLAMIPAEAAELFVTYGTPGAHEHGTSRRLVEAEQLVVFDLMGLSSDREFEYVVHVRRPGEARFQIRPESRFHTLRSPDSTYSFAVLPDSHFYAMWAKSTCGVSSTGWDTLRKSMNAVRDDDSIDFVVIGTDSVMTQCTLCPACSVSDVELAAGGSASALDALLRYRQTFSQTGYGRFARRRPLLYMLGDHDGEKGWAQVGACGATFEEFLWSVHARQQSLPPLPTTYHPGPFDFYYSVRAGDLLLVFLNVQAYTANAPLSPQDWTLGERQLRWLERTLARSDATFKIVFAEHLLGGVSDPDIPCFKARGSLRSTDNGQINGTFLGEQAVVHELLKRHGAQVFFSFHDHVVVVGEKVDEDFVGEGVTYVTGGHAAGGAAPFWTDDPYFQQAMDFDGNGVPEYLTNQSGTLAKGWFRVTVQGKQQVDFEYVRTGGVLDGNVALSFSILP